jgi:hypothetical protein
VFQELDEFEDFKEAAAGGFVVRSRAIQRRDG